jgi:hypothetical protein
MLEHDSSKSLTSDDDHEKRIKKNMSSLVNMKKSNEREIWRERKKQKRNWVKVFTSKNLQIDYSIFRHSRKSWNCEKNSNTSTIDRNIKMLKRIKKYENVSNKYKKLLIQKCEEEIVVKRFVIIQRFLLIFLLICDH